MRRLSLCRFCVGILAVLLWVATPAWSASVGPLSLDELPVLDENANLKQLTDRLDQVRQEEGLACRRDGQGFEDHPVVGEIGADGEGDRDAQDRHPDEGPTPGLPEPSAGESPGRDHRYSC